MKRLISLLLCVATIFFVCNISLSDTFKAKASEQDEIAKLEQELATLDKSQKQKEAELNKLQGKKNVADKKLKTLNDQITTTKSQISNLNGIISNLSSDLAKKTEEKNALQAELDESYKVYKQRIRADFEEGSTTYLDVLFDSKSLSEFMTRLDVISQINEYDNKLIEDMKTKMAQLNSVVQSIEKNKADTENAKDRLDTQKSELSTQYSENEKAKKEIEKDASALQRILEDEERQSEALQKKINSLMSSGTEYSGGIMAWPLPGYTTITSYFGTRIHPITKKNSTHYGIDISTGGNPGKTVVAANDGKVVLVTYDYYGGNMIMIDHGGGIATKYLHLSSFMVSVGQTVKRGENIALSGNTGAWTTGPHLHFEVVVNGSRVNPLGYLK